MTEEGGASKVGLAVEEVALTGPVTFVTVLDGLSQPELVVPDVMLGSTVDGELG